jgi:PGDYG protein
MPQKFGSLVVKSTWHAADLAPPHIYPDSGVGMRSMNFLNDDPKGIFALDGVRQAQKRPIPLQVHFATDADLARTDGGFNAGYIRTNESPVGDPGVRFAPGDAIVTGTRGEQWPIQRDRFEATYVPSDEGGSFGTDGPFHKVAGPVPVRRMDEAFSVSALWGELTGNPGDYLVQYGPGDFGVVSAEIFTDTYDMM